MTHDEYWPQFIDHFRSLGNFKEYGDKVTCNCPVCGDNREKFTITNLHDRFVMNCFNCVGDGGFSYENALWAVGLDTSALHPPKPKKDTKKQIEKRDHVYCNPDGTIFAKKTIRKYDDGSKAAYWSRYESGKYISGLNHQTAPLYRIDEIMRDSSSTIFVAEGEKDADTLLQMGFCATTFPNGGSQTKWFEQYAEPFKDKKIFILTDNDETGEKYGRFVASHIIDLSESVKIIPTTSYCPGAGKKADITDAVDMMGAAAAKDALLKAIDSAEPVKKSDLVDLPADGIQDDEPKNLSRFHKWNDRNPPRATDTNDAAIVQDIIENNFIRVLSGVPRIYAGGYLKEDLYGNYIKQLIKSRIYEHLQTSIRINRIYALLVMDYSIQIELDQCNRQPKNWINFRNGYLDTLTLRLIPHTGDQDKKYCCLNQIPHDWKEPAAGNGVSRKFIAGLIPDDQDRKMFYQFIGYCMTTNTGLQKFLCFVGKGGTGKSELLKLVQSVFGNNSENTSNLSLQQVNERFSTVMLMGKLLNICADIPSLDMDDISALKKATGEDVSKGEFKGGRIVFFKSYARLIFSANRMPRNRDDRTSAYYRRLAIIRVDRRGEFIPDLEQSLHDDIPQFIYDCALAYNEYRKTGVFTISENSNRAVLDLYLSTDSVFAFLYYRTIRNPGKKVERAWLFEVYCRYCEDQFSFNDRVNGYTPHVSARTFYNSLQEMGYRIGPGGERFVYGIEIASQDYEPKPINIEDL